MGRFFLTLVLGVGLFCLVGWQLGFFSGEGRANADVKVNSKAVPPDQLGEPLYDLKVADIPLPNGQVRGRDPLVATGHMNVIEKANLPSEVEGQLLFVGTEVPEGAAQVAGSAAFLGEDYQIAWINQGDSKLIQLYRRLYEGNVVDNDQMVAMINPARALGELQKNRLKINVAQLEQQAAEAAAKEADARWVRAYELFKNKTMAAEEFGTYTLAKIKYYQDNLAKIEGISVAKFDARNSEILFRQHEVRNKIPKQRCQIQTIYRRLSEAVKSQEPIMELWSLDRLMAEALVPVPYLDRLTSARVTIEPIQEQEPFKQLKSHKSAVNAITITGDEKMPLILSASEDNTVCVWTPSSKGPIRVLDHPNPVRSVACSPSSAKLNYWLTGDSEGNVYFWNQTKDLDQQKTLIPKVHRDAVTSLAISSDGRFFATGGADGAINLFTVDDQEAPVLKYPLNAAHGVEKPHLGPVTSLTFTPQSRLVSASKDNTLRAWNLREKGAFLQGKIHEKRAGSVGQLGVSPDGSLMLFDHGKDLQILSVLDGRTINTLHNPAGSIPFDTFALYSPDGQTLLTTGGTEGRLQLWRNPGTTDRAFEIRQFVPQERAAATCAAYSSYPGLGGGGLFAASGSQDGYVYLWALPGKSEIDRHRVDNARLKFVSQNQEASGQVRVGVEVLNPFTAEFPNGRYRPGQPVTILFE